MTRSRSSPPPPPGAAPASLSAPVVGVLVPGRALRVELPGSGGGPIAARTTLSLDDAALSRAAAARTPALLLFENGDPRLPIVIGLLRSETPQLDALLERAPPRIPAEARVDGKRLVLEGQEEVELRCGRAVIRLHRSGEIELEGTRLTSEAKGTHRIRGGKVLIN